jgi:hypothetical protein
MGYDKFGIRYYLDYKDKDYVNSRIEYYIQRLDSMPLNVRSREWFKISKYWYGKAKNTQSIKYKTIYKTIAKRCYKMYLDYKANKLGNPSNDKPSIKIGDFFL